MKEVILGKIPIKMWTDEIETEALRQAENLSNLDFAFKHIALMPDVHVGFGMPIGGVLASKSMIVPNAVGVDIGCGVMAARTDLRHDDIDTRALQSIVNQAHRQIPLGFKKHKKPRDWEGFNKAPESEPIQKELENSRYQLGSLGGGNHFMTIEAGSDGYIWLMVHSGSRNFGYTIANYYNDLAKKLEMNKNSKDLAALPLDTSLGKAYYEDMIFVLDFAKENRRQLLEDFYNIFKEHTDSQNIQDIIQCHHNYAGLEIHYGEEVIVHRKGAIKAEKGLLGIIPGSMGTASYIVEGLGNEESFNSCSHGAGRALSRKKANEELDRNEFRQAMKGIVFREGKDLSEAPMAYKDIEEVMDNQRDLVKTKVKLTPLGVIKG